MTEALERELEEAVKETVKSLAQPLHPSPMPRLRPEPARLPTLMEQFEVYEKCGVELRRRLAEERSEMVAAYERDVAAYEEDVRTHMARMKADLDRRLREHDLLSRRLMA